MYLLPLPLHILGKRWKFFEDAITHQKEKKIIYGSARHTNLQFQSLKKMGGKTIEKTGKKRLLFVCEMDV